MFNRPSSPPYTTKVLARKGLGPLNNPKSSGNTITCQSIRSRPVLLWILLNRADRPDHLTTLTILITLTTLTTANNPTWNNNLQNICQNNNLQNMCELKTLQKIVWNSKVQNLQKVCLETVVAESCPEQ